MTNTLNQFTVNEVIKQHFPEREVYIIKSGCDPIKLIARVLIDTFVTSTVDIEYLESLKTDDIDLYLAFPNLKRLLILVVCSELILDRSSSKIIEKIKEILLKKVELLSSI